VQIRHLSGIDLTSWPSVKGAAATAYGMSAEQLALQFKEHNSIEQIVVLAEAREPEFFNHGDEDQVVPLKENSGEVVRRYSAAGSESIIQLTIAEGQGTTIGRLSFVVSH